MIAFHKEHPAFCDYNKTVYYNTYDVSGYLLDGNNTIEVLLGNVWYNEQQATDWKFDTASWKGTPRFLAELFAGGETETWHSEFGYNGFRYVMIARSARRTAGRRMPIFPLSRPISILT